MGSRKVRCGHAGCLFRGRLVFVSSCENMHWLIEEGLRPLLSSDCKLSVVSCPLFSSCDCTDSALASELEAVDGRLQTP